MNILTIKLLYCDHITMTIAACHGDDAIVIVRNS